MIFVDSTVWIDYFNGRATRQTDYLDGILGKEPLVIGDINYIEVLQGFRKDSDFERARILFDTLFFREVLSREIAIIGARNYRWLRKKGITVRKTIDMIIGTFCIENQFTLLHDDRDFLPLADHFGLKTV